MVLERLGPGAGLQGGVAEALLDDADLARRERRLWICGRRAAGRAQGILVGLGGRLHVAELPDVVADGDLRACELQS